MSKAEQATSIDEIRDLLKQFMATAEAKVNAPIAGTPRIGGRVTYIPLPGSPKKAENVLSPRAMQVFRQIRKMKRATSRDLQRALRVNRNVIAGALAEMREEHLIEAKPVEAKVGA